MTQTATKPQSETALEPAARELSAPEIPAAEPPEAAIHQLRLLWGRRRFLCRAVFAGVLFGTLLAFLLPKRFESTTQLMPPDNQSGSGIGLMAALTAKTGNGLGAVAGDLLGMKSSGALFIGILRSSTVEDRLIERFNLRKAYWIRLEEDARRRLAENTSISEDRKSGIISITVTDGDPRRAAAITQGYVDELDHLVSELSTSSAHRERVFLEGRLNAVKQELDQASKEFSQFASRNATFDIKEQGRAMVDAAALLQGQLIAAQSEVSGLEQIYTENNVRVRALRARIAELQRQQDKIGGKDVDSAPTGGERSFYPSIRELPLLGVTYGDLLRRTKVQEVVYETLTQEYELAKVQEAKETPSVKVLDAAAIPERKSFPPRPTIIFLCAMSALAGGVVWVLGRARWQEVTPGGPGKVFAREVFQTVNARMPWAPQNGSRLQAATHRVWLRLARRNASVSDAESSQN
ncbi:MAG: GNVR domain-containing protein [Candidatus Acidiferrales bacterium]